MSGQGYQVTVSGWTLMAHLQQRLVDTCAGLQKDGDAQFCWYQLRTIDAMGCELPGSVCVSEACERSGDYITLVIDDDVCPPLVDADDDWTEVPVGMIWSIRSIPAGSGGNGRDEGLVR